MSDSPQKITFAEMRNMGVRGVLIYRSDYRCSHSIAVSADLDYGRIVNSKTDSPKRILGACHNPIIARVNAARFMTAASTL